MFAAMRDAAGAMAASADGGGTNEGEREEQEVVDEDEDEDEDEGEVTPEAYRNEIQTRLVVEKIGRKSMPRVTLRNNDNKWFEQILKGDVAEMPRPGARGAKDMKALKPGPESRLVDNYWHLRSLLEGRDLAFLMGTAMALHRSFVLLPSLLPSISPLTSLPADLYTYLQERVMLGVTVPSSKTMAR